MLRFKDSVQVSISFAGSYQTWREHEQIGRHPTYLSYSATAGFKQPPNQSSWNTADPTDNLQMVFPSSEVVESVSSVCLSQFQGMIPKNQLN